MATFPSSPSPTSHAASSPLSRRRLLGGAAYAAGALTLPAGLAACEKPTEGGSGGGTVTLGSNYSDEVPKKALAEVLAGSGLDVKINTVDHNTFQENITRYLQATPDDVFSWFSGFRMQYFAAQGLATDISDIWQSIGGDFSAAMKQASTGTDGKQYFVPFYYYPWAMFYRKSVFREKGYQVPKTWDDLKALAARMRSDGLIPIAMADKDGWPAMGTFDYINMRSNGYDFHVNLMAGKESWEDSRVKQVFTLWRELLPYCQPGANGRTWQEAAQSLGQKQTGMYLLGMFVGQQFQGEVAADMDFFPFPQIVEAHGQDAVEAPIDGFMISSKVKNVDGAKELLRYLASAKAQNAYLRSDPNNVATHNGADTSGYSDLQKKAVELVGGAKQISQFLDRDTRPDFASTVMIPSLQSFLNKPDDVDGLCRRIESQKKTIFAS
ncbi:ABC transporter substrate-binding protein [Plantactinospora sp. KLBMP9567]|uniref:ABC transporter substrate-binding protein n=1 Tax=Plantactinospora sp. KLBMP9567 TaxID=3085900 RepID=UPI0029824C92|nr:ABC transporter substrate-binding protein [Plantactinospora sp. KLBMP9567]MDW5328998.1 ABC transporter substrate-binding protein [Plantactinospora sp. KLBMP9567]